MQILSEKEEKETGDLILEIEYTKEELEIFKKYAEQNGKNIDEMSDADIMQYAVVEILVEQLERENNEQE